MKNTVTMYKFSPGYYMNNDKTHYIIIDKVEDEMVSLLNEEYYQRRSIQTIDEDTYTQYLWVYADQYSAIDRVEDISLLANAATCFGRENYEARLKELLEQNYNVKINEIKIIEHNKFIDWIPHTTIEVTCIKPFISFDISEENEDDDEIEFSRKTAEEHIKICIEQNKGKRRGK